MTCLGTYAWGWYNLGYYWAKRLFCPVPTSRLWDTNGLVETRDLPTLGMYTTSVLREKNDRFKWSDGLVVVVFGFPCGCPERLLHLDVWVPFDQ